MCDRIRLELDSGLAKEKSVSSLWTYFMESKAGIRDPNVDPIDKNGLFWP